MSTPSLSSAVGVKSWAMILKRDDRTSVLVLRPPGTTQELADLSPHKKR